MRSTYRNTPHPKAPSGVTSYSAVFAHEQLTGQTPVLPRLADAPPHVSETEQVERPRRMRRRRAAILDLDGTLLDSNEAQALAWLVALHDFGHEVALDLLRPLVGMTPERVVHHAIGAPASTDALERILERRSQVFRTWYLPRLLPFVGTRALLQRMKRDGLRLIAATNALQEEAEGLARVTSVADLLDDVVSGTDVDAHRQDDVVHAAVGRTGCDTDSIVLLGDTPYDVAAGVRAGIDVVALRCGGWRDSALRGAVALYDDACDLLRHYSSSPFFLPASSPDYTAPQLRLMQ